MVWEMGLPADVFCYTGASQIGHSRLAEIKGTRIAFPGYVKLSTPRARNLRAGLGC